MGFASSGAGRVSLLIIDADLSMGNYKIETDEITEGAGAAGVSVVGLKADTIAEKTAAKGVTVDGLRLKDGLLADVDPRLASNYPKQASANLRNSHDAETITTVHADYEKVKTITITNGIKGTLTIKFDLGTSNASFLAYGRIYKNGVALGTVQSTSNTYLAKENFSEDLAVGIMQPGDTLELWAKATNGYESRTENFRLYYDNDTTALVAVAAATS